MDLCGNVGLGNEKFRKENEDGFFKGLKGLAMYLKGKGGAFEVSETEIDRRGSGDRFQGPPGSYLEMRPTVHDENKGKTPRYQDTPMDLTITSRFLNSTS